MRTLFALVRTIHAWAGAALSLVLIVLGLSGAALVFKADFIRASVPAARAQADTSPAALGAAAEAIEKTFGEHLHHVVFAGQGLGVNQVYLHGETYAYVAMNGDVAARWHGVGRPEEWVYELHHFLLSGDNGMKLAGFCALMAALLAITGLIAWLPFWRATRLRLWPKAARRGELTAAHRNIGLIFAIPVFVFCLTGGAIIFYKTSTQWLVKAFPGAEPEEFFPPANPGKIDWVKALSAAQAVYPKATIRAAVWPQFPAAAAEIRLKQPGEWTPDGATKVIIDPATSTVLGSVDALTVGKGYQLENGLYPVHAAKVGGRLYDAVAFLSGLALATLGVFGLWSFIIKPRKRRARKTAPSP